MRRPTDPRPVAWNDRITFPVGVHCDRAALLKPEGIAKEEVEMGWVAVATEAQLSPRIFDDHTSEGGSKSDAGARLRRPPADEAKDALLQGGKELCSAADRIELEGINDRGGIDAER